MAPRRRNAAGAPAAAAAPVAACGADPALSATAPPPHYDVAIVGLGPVGAFAANVLVNYGMRVLVLERDTAPYAAPRAVAMDDEAVRLFGLIEPGFPDWLQRHLYEAPIDLRTGPPPEAAACLHPVGGGASGDSGASATAAGFTSGWSMVGPLPPRRIAESGGGAEFAFVHQPTVERKLRARLAGLPRGAVDVRLGVEVTAVTPLGASSGGDNDDDGAAATGARGGAPGGVASSSAALPTADFASPAVRAVLLTARDAASIAGGHDVQPPLRASASFVLGCDGGSSGVRKALRIPFEGASFRDEPWLVIDVESDDPALAAAYPCFNFMNAWDATARAYRCVVHVPLPGPRAGRRFEFLLERGEDPGAMTRPESLARLLASVGVHVSRVAIVRSLVYTFHARQAAAWRRGRVLLLGDAAHCMPPFRGQGMCAGLRDAANVCWKVATAVQAEAAGARGDDAEARAPGPVPLLSAAADALLDSYHPERWPHLQATTDIAVAIGTLVQLRRPLWLRAGRNAVMGALYRFPLTRPFFMEPFAPPTSLDGGWLDLHTPHGSLGGGGGVSGGAAAVGRPPSLASYFAGGAAGTQRALTACCAHAGGLHAAHSERAAGLAGWRARDAAIGRTIPNYAVELVNDGSATRVPLDALLQPTASEAAGGTCSGGLGAPVWTLLVSPRLSGGDGVCEAASDAGASRHPLQMLAAVRARVVAAAAAAAGQARPAKSAASLRSAASGGGVGDHAAPFGDALDGDALQRTPLPLVVVGVQLLPVTSAPSRIASVRARQLREAVGAAAAAFKAPARKQPAPAAPPTPPLARAVTAAFQSAAHAGFDAAHGSGGAPPGHGGAIFTSLSAAAGTPWEAAADAAAADSSGRLAVWFDAHGADVALVRPDRLVYGLYSVHPPAGGDGGGGEGLAELEAALEGLLLLGGGEGGGSGAAGSTSQRRVAVALRHRHTLPRAAAACAGAAAAWLLLLALVVGALLGAARAAGRLSPVLGA